MENIFKEEKEIISEYLEADLNDRITMFLHYRGLRPYFAEIDQKIKFKSSYFNPDEELIMLSCFGLDG